MKVKKYFIIIFIQIVLVKHVVCAFVSSNSNENDLMEKLFMKNLEEDYRSISNEKLTPEIANEITSRYKTFKTSRQNRMVRDRRRHKRETHVEGVYVLNGFQEAGSIPVHFPLDICLFKAEGKIFAAALHKKFSKGNDTILSIFKRENGEFIKIFEHNTKMAHYMDCATGVRSGFVAVVNYIEESENMVQAIEESSPVFQVTSDEKVNLVLTFAAPYQNTIHFWFYEDHIFLSHTYKYPQGTSSPRKDCPVYRWSGHQFTLIDQVKCLNSYHIERFEIDFEMFLAVANFDDNHGNTEIFSYIYKYDHSTQSFVLHQQIRTNAADDIRHFEFTYGGKHDEFLIVANAYEVKPNGEKDYETPSLIYKYVNGYFVPFQSMKFNDVEHVLPVIGPNSEFLLLVACKNQDIQIYQYDGWNFVDSPVDYTQFAFGKGVNKMRYYNNFANSSIIVIANENHQAGDSNLFFPIYTYKNDVDTIYEKYKSWAIETIQRYKNQNLQEIIDALKDLPKITDPNLEIKGKLELANSIVNSLETWTVKKPSGVLNNKLVERVNLLSHKVQTLKQQVAYLQSELMPEKEQVTVAKKKDKPSVENLILETDQEETNENLEKEEGDVTKQETVMPQPQTTSAHVPSMTTTTEKPLQPDTTRATEALPEPEVRAAQQQHDTEEIIEIEDLYVKDQLLVEFINGHPISSLLKTDNFMNAHHLTVKITGETIVEGPLYVSEHIDNVPFTKQNLLLKTGDQYIPRVLQSNELVSGQLFTPQINQIPSDIYLNEKANEIVASSQKPVHYDEIIADSLFVNGYFNGLDIREFDSLLLKSHGDQVLEAPYIIDELIATDLVLLNGTISEKRSDDLISIKEGEFIVDASIDFANPVYAEHLFITKRLNNIQMEDGHMDILLKDVNYTQIVTGPKVFDSVKLMNPIGLQGKINSKTLEKMNPITTIPRDLELVGDYEIHGDTIIKQLLQGSDIVSNSGQYSAQRLFRHGLTLDTKQSDVYFTFTQPLNVKNVYTNPSETFNPDDFIKTNTEEIQYVSGHKTFASNLIVKGGICETEEVNKVDIERLGATVLKSNGDQTIEGNIHFKSIHTPSHIATERATLSDVPLSQILTLDTEQTLSTHCSIAAPVTIEGRLEVKNLNTDGNLGDGNLNYLIHDTILLDGREYQITGEKTIEHATIDQLTFASKTGRLNGIDMDTLVWDLDILSEKYIYINDSLYQPKPLKVNNLYVNGNINGVSGQDFGKTWLLTVGDQEFTAPVTVGNVAFDGGLQLEGLLNGHDMEQLYESTIWINGDETIDTLEATSLVAAAPVIVDGLVSGMKLNRDALLRNASEPQLVQKLFVGNLNVKDRLEIESTLNEVDYKQLCNFVYPQSPEPINATIKGGVNFLAPSSFNTINGVDIDDLYQNAWLTHRNVALKGIYHMKYADFTNNIVTTGPVNEFDLDFISKNYFSLTEAQDIHGQFNFQNGTIFNHLSAGFVELGGNIRGFNQKDLFVDIKYLNEYGFRKDVSQEITGLWEIYRMNIEGDLHGVTINDYNLESDVFRYSVNNEVTGDKYIENLFVNNIICESDSCVIQDVDIIDWMANSVLNYGNYTIQGHTSIENVTVFGELKSFGLVNGMIFDKENLLLKHTDQIINGSVCIKNQYPEENRIVPLYFENLSVKQINGRPMHNLLENIIFRSSPLNASVEHLDIIQPLRVKHLHTNGYSMFNVDLDEHLKKYDSYGDITMYEEKFNALETVGASVRESLTQRPKYISEMKLHKGIAGTFTNVVPINLIPGVHHLAAFDEIDPERTVQFYYFNHATDQFLLDNKMPPLYSPLGTRIINVEKLHLGTIDYLLLEIQNFETPIVDQIAFAYFPEDGLQKTWMLNSTSPSKCSSILLNQTGCFVRYSNNLDKSEVHCLGPYGPYLYQLLQGTPISQVAILDYSGSGQRKSDGIVVLTVDGNVVVYEPDETHKLRLKQIMHLISPTTIESVCYEQYCYIAISSDKTENAVHHGSLEIFRAKIGEKFVHFQTINIKIPKKVQFNVLPSEDLLMYVLTNSPSKSVLIYQYSGAAGFIEILSSKTIPRSKSITTMKLREHEREMLAIVAETDVLFIEPILKN